MFARRAETSSRKSDFTKTGVVAVALVGLVLVDARTEALAQSTDTLEYQFCPYDHGSIDGDQVDISLNGASVFTDYTLPSLGAIRCETVEVPQGGNELRIHADNEGDISPNTATLTIRAADGRDLGQRGWELVSGEEVVWTIYATPDEITITLDTEPSFATRLVPRQVYIQNQTITSVTMPEATGGNEPLTYSMSPSPPAGIMFDSTTRVLSGTPTAPSPLTTYTYTVTDADGDTEELTFTIVVNESDVVADAGAEERESVADTIRAVTGATTANITTNIGTRFSAARGGISIALNEQSIMLDDLYGNTLWNADGKSRTLGLDDLLRSSGFQVVFGAAEGTDAYMATQWTLWGRGDLQFFSSEPDQGAGYDGDLQAGYLGFDMQLADQWLAGVAVSHTAAEADYSPEGGEAGEDGRMDITLTSVLPYARFTPDSGTEIWAILGAGTGQIDNLRPGASSSQESDVTLFMGAAGGRRAIEVGGPLDWALLGDYSTGQVETDDGAQAIAGLTVDVWRARVGVEGSHTTELEGGNTLTSFMEVAGRYDGGDGEEETGLEISPGLYFSASDRGFGLEVRGSVLALHSAENYEEFGLSMTASYSPGSDGLGLAASLTPSWGTETATDTLWRDDDFGRLALRPKDREAMSLNARAGYGIRAMSGLLTPFGEIAVRDQDNRKIRVGARFRQRHSNLGVELSGERREWFGDEPDHRVGVIGRLRF